MKLLTFSTLYPNAAAPSHGVFVENRLRHLVDGGNVESRVVAPVPWFPSRAAAFGRFAEFAKVPARETRSGLEVLHPRYLTVPGIGMYATPMAIALGARGAIARLIREGFDFDAIDAHYLYPDGAAAALLARWFDRPLVVTARGSDVTELPAFAVPRRLILWAAQAADAIITVSASLKRDLRALGADDTKIVVLRNGVDLERFRPIDPAVARERFGLPAGVRVIASVGHLIPRKGHELVIEALASLPDTLLLIAGSGPDLRLLEETAARFGVADRVRFLGQQRHDALPAVYSASDVLVLASSNEGWANVLLESMACGTPVVASDAGGTSEVVTAPEAGTVLPERTAAAIAQGLRALFAALPDRAATRRYAERYSWDETTRGQENLFRRFIARTGDIAAPTVTP